MVRKNLQKSSQSRVWTIEDRVGPSHVPRYQALARAGAASQGLGTITPVRIQDPNQYGQFITVDKIRGQADLITLPLEFRMTRDISDMVRLVRKGCPLDVQIHVGACKDPTDFDLGWEKIMVFEDADVSNWSTADLGAFDGDQDTPVIETLELMALDYFEIKPLGFSQQASSEIVQQVAGVVICDSRTCGACGLPSDGCQRVFAVQVPAGASPGLPAEVVFTTDGGATWTESIVTSLAANEAPVALLCAGPYLVVISNASGSIHTALITDILEGTETWAENDSGFNVSGQPNAGFSVSRTQTWFVGDGGYIYFASDPTATVETQSSGDVTSQDLVAIHGLDEDRIIVGGGSNALLSTENGGSTWSAVTASSDKTGVGIVAVHMISETEWLVGYTDGDLYFTIDGGINWEEKTLPGSISAIDGIAFSNRTVGYIIGRSGSNARILRTINGGYSWYVLPESQAARVPTAERFYAVDACDDDPNVVYFGGIVTSGGDGILVKGA